MLGWRTLDRWERALLALAVAGLALRALHLGGDSLAADSSWYATMAESLLRYGEFYEPWQPDLRHTHHFPPLYPAFLALFFLPFGASYLAIQLANLVAAVLFVGVAFLCTRDLYGRRPAFVVAAVSATLPTFVAFDREGLSETLVAALFALTIWAILKSLERPRFIVLAGLFAGMGYLAKASMGPFFLLAGGAGFLWRFAYVRWAVFRDRWYLLAAALFAALVLPWAARNVLRHGWPNWQTQPYASAALDRLFAESLWPLLFLQAFFWATFLLLLHAAPFLPGALSRRRRWREESTTGLLLAIFTPLFVAGFFIAAFARVESFRIAFSPHPARYALTPIVPLLWLAVRDLDWAPAAPGGEPTSGAARVRRARLAVVAGASLIALALATREPYFLSSDARDIALLLGVSGLGLALLALSRVWAWEPVARRGADGATSWRAAPRKLPRWAPWLGLALFVAAWFNAIEWIPLGVAAAGAAMVATWRQRALVVGVVFLGWSLGGAMDAQPYDLVGAALDEMGAPGDTVAASIGVEPHLWPFVPHDMRQVLYGAEPATFLVDATRSPAPPPGYELAGMYGKQAALAPASLLRYHLDLLVTGREAGEPAGTVAIYRAIAAT